MGRRVLPIFRSAGILPAKNTDRDVCVPSNNKAGAMKKLLLVLYIIFVVKIAIWANTITVSLDSSQDLTSIQTAVDCAADGDTILVHPGRYFENVDFCGKSITITSNYINNPDWSIVESTIIDGNQQSSCVVAIDYEENAVLNGFTLTNGIGSQSSRFGGGVFQKRASTLTVSNCLIHNNNAITGGGISTGSLSNLTLSGNIIKNNNALHEGGGVGLYGSTVYFDPVNLNSIYNNYGDVQDVYLYNSTSNDIALDTLSVDLTTPDGFFVSYFYNSYPTPPTITNQHSYLSRIDADLYVSELGDDSNDGLTPETALQTIAFATRLIQPNEQNPNTVFILPGTYSEELNNQIFPIAVQSNTKLLGTGNEPTEVTIGDEWNLNTIAIRYAANVEVGNFQMLRNDVEDEYTLLVSRSENIVVSDIDFGESHANKPGIYVLRSSDIDIFNCCFHDITGFNGEFICVYMNDSIANLNNIIVNNNRKTANEGLASAFHLSGSSVNANNIIVSNNLQSFPGVLVQYGNSEPLAENNDFSMSNLLVYNNTSTNANNPLVIFTKRFNQSNLNNISIANNTGPTGILRLAGGFNLRNSIIYNPDAGSEINIWVPSSVESYPLYSYIDADYNLIRGGESGVYGTYDSNNTLVWGSHNIDTDPLFRGDVHGDVGLEDIKWVQLTQGSPCVNAGTPDTLGMNLPTVDIAGNPRVWDNIIDMGAYEYNPTPNSDETALAPPATIQVSHFPNPVTPNGSNGKVAFIEFTLPKKPIEKPMLEIYNIKGQKVRDLKITQSFSQLVRSAGLSSKDKQTGEHYSKIWDCKDNNRKVVA